MMANHTVQRDCKVSRNDKGTGYQIGNERQLERERNEVVQIGNVERSAYHEQGQLPITDIKKDKDGGVDSRMRGLSEI